MILRKFRALGRKKPGFMNKTEEAHSWVLEGMKQRGEIIWYRFESLKFVLANNTTYTPDFVVLYADMHVELHEVKGNRVEDDAWAKLKIAAAHFPLFTFMLYQRTRKGVWEVSEIPCS